MVVVHNQHVWLKDVKHYYDYQFAIRYLQTAYF